MKNFNPPFKSLIILTQYFFPEPGAAQIRLGELSRELKGKGVEVSIITGMPNYPEGKIFDDYKNKFYKKENWHGIPIKRVWLYPASGKGTLSRLLNYFSFTFFSFWVLLFSRRSQLIFVEAQPIILAIPAFIIKILKGTPYIYNTPDLQVEHAEEAGWLKSKSLLRIAKKLEELLMRNSLSVCVVTKAYIKHFMIERNLPFKKFTFLPNGANTKQLFPIEYNKVYAEKMGISNVNTKIFTYAGTNAPYQGLENIIYACEYIMKEKVNNIKILMAGKGPERTNLINLSKKLKLDNIFFVDSPFTEMRQLMSITYASLVVLKNNPTAKKQRLSKVIPPLACEVPVIFAGTGESKDMIDSNECGMTLMPENPKLLALSIIKLSNNESLRNHYAKNGLKLVNRELSWTSIVNKWIEQLKYVYK